MNSKFNQARLGSASAMRARRNSMALSSHGKVDGASRCQRDDFASTGYVLSISAPTTGSAMVVIGREVAGGSVLPRRSEHGRPVRGRRSGWRPHPPSFGQRRLRRLLDVAATAVLVSLGGAPPTWRAVRPRSPGGVSLIASRLEGALPVVANGKRRSVGSRAGLAVHGAKDSRPSRLGVVIAPVRAA